jgi:hypothetical protein
MKKWAVKHWYFPYCKKQKIMVLPKTSTIRTSNTKTSTSKTSTYTVGTKKII